MKKKENRGRRKGEGEWGRVWGGRERGSGEGSEKGRGMEKGVKEEGSGRK